MAHEPLRTILRVILYLGLVFAAALLVAAMSGPCFGDWRPFLDAIRQVESGGNNKAVGDDGDSKGPMQCGRAAWKEACEYMGVAWDYDHCVWLRFESEAVLIGYVYRWGAKTWEERARIWNGGPRGHKKKATLGYWSRVKAILERRG